MKQCKKVIALVLALVMLTSVFSVCLTANANQYKSVYTGTGLDGTMNSADQYELTDGQYLVLMFDYLDKVLEEANIPVITQPLAAGFIANINAKSITGLCGTIRGIRNLLKSASSVPLISFDDAEKLDLSAFDDPNILRCNTSNPSSETIISYDKSIVTALLKLLNSTTNAGLIKKLVQYGLGSGSNQFSAGTANGFLPSNVTDITNDIVGFLKKTLFNDSNANFDTEIAKMITSMVNEMDLEFLPGFSVSTSDTIYTLIDKAARSGFTYLKSALQSGKLDVEEMVLNNIDDFETQYPYIDLKGFKDIDFDFEDDGMGTAFNPSDSNTYLVYHVNDLIGNVIEHVVPSFNDASDPDYTGGWTEDATPATSLATLNENLAKAAQFADIKLTGGTFTDEEIAQMSKDTKLKAYAMVLADALLKMFFPSLKVEKADILAGNICTLAVQALNEFFTYYIPEKTRTAANGYAELYTYKQTGTEINRNAYSEANCKTIYKQMLAEMLAKFVSGYFPVDSSHIKFTNTSDLDGVLKAIAKYFLNTVCKAGSLSQGALGTISNSETVYTAFDRIILSINSSGSYVEGCTNGGRNTSGILPKGFLPASITSKTLCTSKDLVDHLFNCVEGLDFGALFKILIPNTGSNTEMNTAVFPTLACYEVIRILNVIFPGIWTSKTGTINALITNSNLGTIIYNLLTSLNANYHVYPGLKLAGNVLGAASSQKMGDAAISLANSVAVSDNLTIYKEIEPIINATSTSIPSGYCIKVSNTSTGINGGYKNASGTEMQFKPYSLKVKSIVCETSSKVVVNNAVDTIIDSNSNKGFTISGTAPKTNTDLTFKVTYAMSNEDGGTFPITQEERITVFYGQPSSMNTLTSNTVSVMVPSKVYATPSTIGDIVGYYKTSDISKKYSGSAEDSTFPSISGFVFKGVDVGTPDSTAWTQFKLFNVTKPDTIPDAAYASHSITYALKTMDTSAENATYGSNTTKTMALVIYDDGGLKKLVDKYAAMTLQQEDFTASAWSSFMTLFNEAQAMIHNPSAAVSGTTSPTPAQLKSAFAAKATALEAAYKVLENASSTDYRSTLKTRLDQYANGNEDTKDLADYHRWDYTPVSYTRYDASLSTVQSYYNNKESSSVKINEALRYNEEMAKLLFTSNATINSKSKAKTNLQEVYNAYSQFTYSADKYTPASYQALTEAIAEANDLLTNDLIYDKTILKSSDALLADGTAPDQFHMAQATYRRPRTTEYAEARVAILSALNQLVESPFDSTKIADLVALLNTIHADERFGDNMYWTDEAWDTFKAAYDQANIVINDPYSLLKDGATVSSVESDILTKYLPALQEAFTALQQNPYVSSLIIDSKNCASFEVGEKLIVGSRVIEAEDYVVVPYGCDVETLVNGINYSTNASRYKKDDNDNWQTYCSFTTPAATCYDDSNEFIDDSTTVLRTGFTLHINDGADVTTYKVVVSGNFISNDGTSSAKTTKPTKKNEPKEQAILDSVLPNLVANVGVDTFTVNQIMACDLNGDGMVDNTDLVLLVLWKAGKYVPFNYVGYTG